METLTIASTIVAILVSAASIFIALKKSKPEIRNIDAITDKTRAEIIKIYGEELLALKEQYKNERKENEDQISSLKKQVSVLSKELEDQIRERREEKLEYREFINTLLMGINKLIRQFQEVNVEPVWSPPTKTPFDCE